VHKLFHDHPFILKKKKLVAFFLSKLCKKKKILLIQGRIYEARGVNILTEVE
jgi:hypothetical protein